MILRKRSSWVWLLLLCVAATARAQTSTFEDEAARARVHLGPLALDPRISLRNIGVDTNALNTETETRRDLTATIRPEVRSWLRMARLGLTGNLAVDWNYYRTLAEQRSFDAIEEGRADLFLTVVQPHVAILHERTRQRVNLEIDARVRRTLQQVGGGFLVRIGPRTTADLAYEVRRFEFGAVRYGGVLLSEALNREEAESSLTLRHDLTPLTTLVLRGGGRRDRFAFTPERDTDSVLLLPGLEFKPLALVSGRAAVGIREFSPRNAALQAFRGVVSDVELSYVFRDRARATVTVARDVDYSFEPNEPYYISTGVGATIVQALGDSWDAVARASRTTLDYRRLRVPGAFDPSRFRVDRVTLVGLGIGRRVGTDVRLGLDVDRAERRSSTAGRNYEGYRVGGSITYGY